MPNTAKDPPTPLPLLHEEAPALSPPLLPQTAPSWEAMFPSKIERVVIAPEQNVIVGKVAFPQATAKALPSGFSTDSAEDVVAASSPSPSPPTKTRVVGLSTCLNIL